MFIKRLEIEDIPEIVKMRERQELERNYNSELLAKYLPLYNDWLKKNLNQSYHMFGIITDNQLVAIYGLMLLEHHNESVFYGGNAYTLPGYRKKGLMSLLIEQSLVFAKSNNIDIVEAVIDSSTPGATWHLAQDKYGAEKQNNRYSILLDDNFRFASFINALTKIGDNKYIIKSNNTETTIIVDLDYYISHPLNPSGKTLLISIYNADEVTSDELTNAIKTIINEYLNKGVYYFKVLCSGFNPQILLDLGFTQETGYIRMLTKKGNE